MNHRHICRILGIVALCVAGEMPATALTLRCTGDPVKVGDACIDTHEASVWQVLPSNAYLVKRVQAGRAVKP